MDTSKVMNANKKPKIKQIRPGNITINTANQIYMAESGVLINSGI